MTDWRKRWRALVRRAGKEVVPRPVAPALAPAARDLAAPPTAREAQLQQEVETLRQELRALAEQDPLTGLASARRFHDRLSMAMIHAQRQGQKLAVVQLALDRFAALDRQLSGRGDDLLRSVALALESTLRQGDSLARLAEDEVFTLLLPGIRRDEDVTVVADKLHLALRGPFSIGGDDLHVTASLGIALFPDDGADVESLLHGASVALRRVRQRGGDSWEVHAPDSRARAARRQAHETALRRALAGGGLELYWQPVVACEGGAITGMEALLRWRGRDGLATTADLVSLDQLSALAVPLGQWLLREACRQGGEWQRGGHAGLIVSVKLSLRQLAHPAAVKLATRVLGETALAASSLELTVTETELLSGRPAVAERLAELRRLGLRVALEGFGSADSRLGDPHRFPLDTLRLDPALLRAAAADPAQEAMVSAAVVLARPRRLRVVAEGVATGEHLRLAQRCGCSAMLGPLFGAPMTPLEAEATLRTGLVAPQPQR